MKISTKGRYALRMLLDLAEHQQDGFKIRRAAIETGVNVLTAIDTAGALISSLEQVKREELSIVDVAEIKRA